MLAAIATEQAGPEALVPETLAEAKYLQIIELEDGTVSAVLPLTGEESAVRALLERGCRALITGQISSGPRELLRRQDVLCFDGYLYQAQQVRRLLYTGVLPGIK